MAMTSSVIEKPVAHTRGPWIVSGYSRDRQLCIEQGGYAVAYACPRASSPASGPQYYEREANARLIAAAPELLQLVREALQHFTEDQDPENDTPHLIDLRDWTKAARTAVAKAEGAR